LFAGESAEPSRSDSLPEECARGVGEDGAVKRILFADERTGNIYENKGPAKKTPSNFTPRNHFSNDFKRHFEAV
jgi:hypothetical protein